MALTSGTRLGPYEIQSAIGAGGMGEVYKARDTRLDRTVAIKVLPSHIALDPTLRERFEREARAISALEHPHICPMYDVGSEGGTDYLVMQHLDGETLASRLARGPLPLDQALKAATEIADALDAAHRRGIVHRDLKPGNVMLTKSGAKLLDFGLATTSTVAPSFSSVSGAAEAARYENVKPTVAASLTAQGTILGTLQYMAPEQIEGRDADARTDIFAFGAMLFEMVTGRRAFEAQSGPSLIAAILSSEPPPLSRLQPVAPRALDRLVRRCLAKNPDDRWHCARDLLLELRSIEPDQAAAAAIPPRSANRYLVIATALSLLAAVGLAVQRVRQPAPDRQVRALELSLQLASGFGTGIGGVLSPDGLRLAYTSLDERGRLELRLRQMDGITDRLIAVTRGAHNLFWSPDSRWLAYSDGDALMRLQIDSGVPERLTTMSAQGRGGTWSRDGQILYSDQAVIKRLSIDTREVVPVTTLDRAAGERGHRWPWFLTDGRRFVFTSFNADAQRSALMLGSLDGGSPRRIIHAASRSAVASGGYLLFARNAALMVQAFDERSGQVTGDAQRLAHDVGFVADTGASSFSVDDAGTLAVIGTAGANPNRLRWYDRSGAVLREVQHDPFRLGGSSMDLSPDGRRAAVTRVQEDGSTDIWLVDLERATMSRLTSETRNDRDPVWTPDGRGVVFRVLSDLGNAIIRKPADASAPESTLLPTERTSASRKGGEPLIPQDWSRDGRVLLFVEGTTGRHDVFAFDESSGTTTPVVETPYSDGQAQFSPDDSWVAFSSDETGAFEVYVQRFPKGGDRMKVSTTGGQMPRWSPDGRSLYYVTLAGDLMNVPLDLKAATAGAPQRLFRTTLGGVVNQTFRYALSPDGTRFLIADGTPPGRTTIQVVLNWPKLMKRQR